MSDISLTTLPMAVAAASAREAFCEMTTTASALPKLNECPTVPDEVQTENGFFLGSNSRAIFSEKGKANFMPAGILILMYVINILAGLQENLRNLKYLSFFYYFNPSKLLVHGELDSLAWFVFLGTFIVSTSLAIFWFNKRDISV